MNIRLAKLSLLIILCCCSASLFSQTFIPGNTYYDSTGYVEYRAGNIPIILSAPHGGDLEPTVIPDRTCTGCTTVKDSWTKTITEGIYDAFIEQTGCYPHVIINLLHRKKFDANRDIGTAADGNPTVENAWHGYHAFIDSAKAQVTQDYGRSLFLDIHGHAHTIQRIELGYLLSRSELQLSDSMLNTIGLIEESSIRTLEGDNLQNLTHSELIRGIHSFGTLMDNKGFPSVPSFSDPFPLGNDAYFSGGYNTQRHGSRDNQGEIDAIQIELNQNARFDATNRALLIDSLTTSAIEYIDYHYNNQFISGNFCHLISSTSTINSTKNSFILYPNPTTSYFNLKGATTEADVFIYNYLGQIVLSEYWTGNSIHINHLPKGMYFVQIRKENTLIQSIKLIKE